MPRYLFTGNYTLQGIQGVVKDGGSARAKALEATASGVGGSLVSFDFAFGGKDFYVIVDLPDDTAAAAVSLRVGASGAAEIKTIKLLTPAEVDRATQVSVSYSPPGA